MIASTNRVNVIVLEGRGGAINSTIIDLNYAVLSRVMFSFAISHSETKVILLIITLLIANIESNFCQFGQTAMTKLVWLSVSRLHLRRSKVCLTWNLRIRVLDIVMSKIVHKYLFVEWSWPFDSI